MLGNETPSSRATARSAASSSARPTGGELAQPGGLAVDLLPADDRLAQVVELHAAVVVAGPHVLQRATELGVPHQRRQVVEDERHPDVVDRGSW